MNSFNEFRIKFRADCFRNFGKLEFSLFFRLFNRKYKLLLFFRLCQYYFPNRKKSLFNKILYKILYIYYNNLQQIF